MNVLEYIILVRSLVKEQWITEDQLDRRKPMKRYAKHQKDQSSQK